MKKPDTDLKILISNYQHLHLQVLFVFPSPAPSPPALTPGTFQRGEENPGGETVNLVTK